MVRNVSEKVYQDLITKLIFVFLGEVGGISCDEAAFGSEVVDGCSWFYVAIM